MGDDTEYTYKNWKELFNFMHYCYEDQYDVELDKDNSIHAVHIYKGTFTSTGEVHYKGDVSTYDPVLWPKVKLFAQLFEENGVVNLLYGDKDE